MPKSAHPAAKKALAEIWGAEDKGHARAAAKVFADLFGVKFPKAVAKVIDDLDELLAFYDYPAEHWVHLRTTNPIVISSTPIAVVHVDHGIIRARDLRRGPGYLPRSMMVIFRRHDACPAGPVTGLAA